MTNARTLQYSVFNIYHVSFKILAAIFSPPFRVYLKLQEQRASVVDYLLVELLLSSVGTQIVESVRSNPLFCGNEKDRTEYRVRYYIISPTRLLFFPNIKLIQNSYDAYNNNILFGKIEQTNKQRKHPHPILG